MNQNNVFQKKLEKDAQCILATACQLASHFLSVSFDFRLALSNTQWSWEGKRECVTVVTGSNFHLYFALHEILESGDVGQVYYAESGQLASHALPSALVSPHEALCNVIAHEVAHLFLFVYQPSYGRNGHDVHDHEWLELMLSLRERLISVFCFCPKLQLRRYHQGHCTVNFNWDFIRAYLQSKYVLEHGYLLPVKMSCYLRYIENLIHKLIRYQCYEGLSLVSRRLF
ncbi:SprT-like domain-containing protein [Vibrio vulnificus]|uniref:SprT-like domain-containing protein n=1 Tax=Vibrio vulnificus TaxID=672 RepID=UPI001A26B049|nr:hypothetical protein [Vibrio vulnificus]HAS6036774.1 hypothetical protein [Vibrio vulnificus]HAS6410249.1 hypothetical protein [Vibrio vulnificus]HAS6415222.1 hypothetical protein [Vibrio vulnificus]HDY7429191.1 SprT-like domain-containing protein [Vibrio vulnificus]